MTFKISTHLAVRITNVTDTIKRFWPQGARKSKTLEDKPIKERPKFRLTYLNILPLMVESCSFRASRLDIQMSRYHD